MWRLRAARLHFHTLIGPLLNGIYESKCCTKSKRRIIKSTRGYILSNNGQHSSIIHTTIIKNGKDRFFHITDGNMWNAVRNWKGQCNQQGLFLRQSTHNAVSEICSKMIIPFLSSQFLFFFLKSLYFGWKKGYNCSWREAFIWELSKMVCHKPYEYLIIQTNFYEQIKT